MTNHTAGLSRRSVAKGAAWAIPAITLTTAPMVAATDPDVIEIVAKGTACKLPGASCQGKVGVTKGYAISVEVCNSGTTTATIEFDPATVTLGGVTTSGWEVGPSPLTIAVGKCETLLLGLKNEPSSQNVSISGSISFSWTAGTETGTGAFAFAAPSTPPCVDCAPPV